MPRPWRVAWSASRIASVTSNWLATPGQQGIERSKLVSFDPRATKLSGTNVQDALTELEGRVSQVESGVLDDLGERA